MELFNSKARIFSGVFFFSTYWTQKPNAKNRQKNTAHSVYTDRSNVCRRKINRITFRAQHIRGHVGERRRIWFSRL